MAIGLFRRGLSRVISAGRTLIRETSVGTNFALAENLFFASPQILGQMQAGQITQPYSQHVWVYACVNAIAQSVSSVPLLFKTGPRKDPKVVEDERLDSLFEAPNPYMSGSQLIEATLVYLGLTGEAFYIVERESDREIPKEIWIFHPHRFKEVVNRETGLISGWVYSKGANKVPLQTHEVVFFRYFNPYNDYRGLSPLQAARAGIEQDFWAARYNMAFFMNAAQPGGVLETSANLNDDEFHRLLAQFEDRHRGAPKSHRIALLEGGVTYKQTGLSQKDMDFLEQRKWNREEIMAAFKVPKTEVGLYEDVNYATAKTQRKLFWENTLLPKMALIEFVLWGQLLRRIDGGRVWAEFDYAGISALQEDRRELVESAQKLWSMGVPLNIANEYLGLGLPAVAGGDVGYLPFNLAPVAQGKPSPEKTVVDLPFSVAPVGKNFPAETAHEKAIAWKQAGMAGYNPLPAVSRQASRTFDGEVYWQNYLKIHGPLEEKFYGKIKRFFYEQRKTQLQIIEEQLSLRAVRDISDNLLFDLSAENAKLQKVVWPLYVQIGMEAGQALYKELGQVGALFNLEDSEALAVLQQKLIRVTGINETTREALRNTISQGLQNQEPWTQIADRVREVYNFAASRSYTIARTETGQAMGTARYAGTISMGIQKIMWVTAADERVRLSHRNLNGVKAEIGQVFVNGCRFPCDPYGPPGEIINCRCCAAPVVE